MRALLVASFYLLLTGCLALSVDTPPAPACLSPAIDMARVELIFGTTHKNGQPIPASDWDRFLAEEVTPRFPEGLTQFDVYGQWRKPDGVIAKLPSRMLLIWYTPSDDAERRIEAVRDRFVRQFEQLSVMRIDGRDCVRF